MIKKLALLLLPVVVHAIACLLAFDPTPHTGGDNATYISLATALWQGHGYVDLWDPALPAHRQFPPGFPALLALAFSVGLRPLVAFKLIVIATSVGAVAACAAALRRLTSPGVALALGVLLAALPGFSAHATWILADAPAWACVAIGWWACLRWHERPGAGWLALTLVAFLAAVFTRTACVSLVGGVLLWSVWQRSWKLTIGLGVGVFLPALAWNLRGGSDSPYSRAFWFVDPYQPELGSASVGQVLMRVPGNLARYGTELLPSLFSPGILGVVLAAIVLVLAIVGLVRTKVNALAVFMLAPAVVMLLIWPTVWADSRYLLPMIPLLFALGANALPDVRATVAAATVMTTLMIPAHVTQAQKAAQCRAGAICVSPAWHEWFTIADEARRVLPADTVVLSRKPTLLFLIAGLRGRSYPTKPGVAALLDEAASAGAQYILADGFSDLARRYLWPAINEAPGRFCVIRSGEQAVLLRIEPPGSVASELRPCH